MEKATIHYYDIGDYLSREDKLRIIRQFGSIENIPWTIIHPNEHGDWLNKRSETFKLFMPIEPEKKFADGQKAFFSTYAIGVATNRDAWVYNYSVMKVEANMRSMIDFYNEQRQALSENAKLQVEEFVDTDTTKISWTVNLKKDLSKGIQLRYEAEVRNGVYRPFCKQKLYYDRHFIERIGISPKLFPTSKHNNLVICISCVSANNGLSVLMTDCIPDLHYIGDTQCFPLYWYEDTFAKVERDFFEEQTERYVRHDGVTDWILDVARRQYGYKVGKEDIFYYVYGLLHSPDYRAAFSADLKKSLPRLPLVGSADDFWAFSQAGRRLAALHLNYEEVEPYRKCDISFGAYTDKDGVMNYRVEKMRFGKKDTKTVDKSVIHYNDGITITKVPAEAYEYVVNGKSAIEWVMERYAVTTDKKSQITNDPNDWAREHGDDKYIFNLLLRVITVSVKTVEIVKGLPKLKFEE